MNNDLYIIHYGVGHDKGGHSGRYPWGSGERPYGGVNPKTKKSDLFKLNGRKFNDVASDLIVKKKYGDRTDVTEEQIAQSKARTQAFLRGVEATILTTVAGAVGETALSALTASSKFNQMAKDSADFTKQYVDKQTGLLNMYKGIEDKKSTNGSYNARMLEDDLRWNKRIADGAKPGYNRTGQTARVGLWDPDQVKGMMARQNNDTWKSQNNTTTWDNITTWDNAAIKTFETQLKSDFDDFEKQWKETNDRINATKSRF